ncbi:MAG: hypothetical protein IJ871_03140 [Ruminococcus sp.]|nr:hypothetical protein [Ruminococcus sp.]
MSKKFKLDKKAKQRIEQQFPDDTVGEFADYEDYDPEEEERTAQKKRRRARRTARFMIRLTAFFMLLVLIMVSVMLYTGYIWFNEPRKRDYPCRGVIVDNDMGQIGWQAFSGQNISFAYITATKGKDYIDERFEYNKKNSASTELYIGYLHLFEPDENGRAQAEHFIEAVGESMAGRLIPAVSIELRGLDRVFSPDEDNSLENLQEFVTEIEAQYGVSPIILCRYGEYEDMVLPNEELSDCKIWTDSVFTKPKKGLDWTLWTYSPRVRLKYYETNSYLDAVVFNGSEEKFRELIVPKNGQ